jgi:hypothetical protein
VIDVRIFVPGGSFGGHWSIASLDPARIVGWVPGHYDGAGGRSVRYWRPILDTGAIADVHVAEYDRETVAVAQKVLRECPSAASTASPSA